MTDRLLPDSHPASALRGITESHEQSSQEEKRLEAAKDLHGFLTEEQCVGDIISMDYDTAEVLIHDRLRRDVGGVPHGCLLLATRLKPDPEPAALAECDLADPQVSLILLRALRSSPLPNDIEMKEARLRAGQRAAQTEHNWDEGGKTDLFTLDQMRYAGAHCRILGTFRMATDGDSWNLRFGGDIDNFYAGQGLKVYKPVGESLGRIINHRRTQDLVSTPVRIGIPRYAASAPPSGADSPGYELSVRDLVAQRTALFGMTRTGKSNTTKTNRIAGEQIARHLFQCQQRSFVSPKINRVTREVERPPPVIIYAEEAHTLLPKGEESDTGNIWSRIAKEGAKFNIGLVYSTQEPSSIQTNILKNTENWLIAHLNNSDELREVAKYNDFADFKDSILKVREVGLLRVRTLSSPFTVPVQIDKFVVGDDDAVRG